MWLPHLPPENFQFALLRGVGQAPLPSKFISPIFHLLVKVEVKLEEDEQLAGIASAVSSQPVCHITHVAAQAH